MPSAGHLNLKALRWLKETPTTYGGFAFAAHNFFQNKLIDMYIVSDFQRKEVIRRPIHLRNEKLEVAGNGKC
ncbi:hypothetical protein SUGI_0907180 [Cryptomeria japonica]|nr:hypothetical protein SUGI_0907180 [Cryptomeria japonica]